MINYFYIIVIIILSCQSCFLAQEFSESIEDNSFLIEEAYNQDEGVVQHIFNAVYFTKPEKDLMLSFTQEWPLFNSRNQISYSIPFSSLNSDSVSGVGDILINYRYQISDKSSWAVVTPRISIILPSGNYDKGLGHKVVGVQFGFPFSKRLSDGWIAHFNIGLTFLPNVKTKNIYGEDFRNNLINHYVGGSLIWLARSDLNFFLEYLKNYDEDVDINGDILSSTEDIINPGVRYGFNISNLQIVPGISMPISITPELTRAGVFFYLSFEHPF